MSALKVGSYTPPDENGEGEKIVREFYGQGHIFKDEDAFYHRPDDPCYIPELSDTVYTRNRRIWQRKFSRHWTGST